MATITMMPDGAGKSNPIKINGRTYSATLGTTISVPDYDAAPLEANGWIKCAAHGSGATAARPTSGLFKGHTYLDTTLGVNVIWDGLAWRHHGTGASA